MCRNIRPLFNFEPPATDEEVHAAALQYVRKISGTRKPSGKNLERFDEAVNEIAAATRKLVDRAKSVLTTTLDLSEPEAFRWIQKTSMDRRLSMREVAETIINQVN